MEEKFKNISLENTTSLSLSDLVEAFNYFKSIRDDFIKENKIDKAKVEQEKINIIVNDERLDQLFQDNEFGYSKICDINQVIKDREVIWPLILR